MVVKHISLEQIQRDINVGWKIWCDEHIHYWRCQVSVLQDKHCLSNARRQLKFYQGLRRWK